MDSGPYFQMYGQIFIESENKEEIKNSSFRKVEEKRYINFKCIRNAKLPRIIKTDYRGGRGKRR